MRRAELAALRWDDLLDGLLTIDSAVEVVRKGDRRGERVTGGWRIHGRKMFGSLGPVWDRIGIHAMDNVGPRAPVVVHAFVHRNAPGVMVVPTWDAEGMRATESHDTVLDGAFVADADVLCVVPAGPSNDLADGGMLVWALTLISNV